MLSRIHTLLFCRRLSRNVVKHRVRWVSTKPRSSPRKPILRLCQYTMSSNSVVILHDWFNLVIVHPRVSIIMSTFNVTRSPKVLIFNRFALLYSRCCDRGEEILIGHHDWDIRSEERRRRGRRVWCRCMIRDDDVQVITIWFLISLFRMANSNYGNVSRHVVVDGDWTASENERRQVLKATLLEILTFWTFPTCHLTLIILADLEREMANVVQSTVETWWSEIRRNWSYAGACR